MSFNIEVFKLHIPIGGGPMSISHWGIIEPNYRHCTWSIWNAIAYSEATYGLAWGH